MLTEMAVFDDAVWNGEAPSPVAVAAQSNSEAQQAFIRGMLEMPTQQDTRNPLELVVSVVLHAIIIGAILIAPLIFTGTINLGRFEQTFLVAPPPPAAAPPPAQAEKVVKAMSRPIPTQAITQPVVIPAKIRIVHDAAPPDPGTLGVIGGISGGAPNGVLGGIIGGTSTIAVPPPPPAHLRTRARLSAAGPHVSHRRNRPRRCRYQRGRKRSPGTRHFRARALDACRADGCLAMALSAHVPRWAGCFHPHACDGEISPAVSRKCDRARKERVPRGNSGKCNPGFSG